MSTIRVGTERAYQWRPTDVLAAGAVTADEDLSAGSAASSARGSAPATSGSSRFAAALRASRGRPTRSASAGPATGPPGIAISSFTGCLAPDCSTVSRPPPVELRRALFSSTGCRSRRPCGSTKTARLPGARCTSSRATRERYPPSGRRTLPFATTGSGDTARKLMGIAAALHSAPVEVAPEAFAGRGAGSRRRDPLLVRALRRRGLGRVPVLDWGFAWLLANTDRVSGRRAVLHGDLRTGNYIVRDGGIVALLDWEEAHLGDPCRTSRTSRCACFAVARGSLRGLFRSASCRFVRAGGRVGGPA